MSREGQARTNKKKFLISWPSGDLEHFKKGEHVEISDHNFRTNPFQTKLKSYGMNMNTLKNFKHKIKTQIPRNKTQKWQNADTLYLNPINVGHERMELELAELRGEVECL